MKLKMISALENEKDQNPLFCDPETGVCEIPNLSTSVEAPTIEHGQKPLTVLYFTDPICSSCWGIEPQLKKLKLEYGEYLDFDYHMGGLLKSWDTYGGSDVDGAVSVASHWDEASAAYKMPIDGNVWLTDPMDSSYPPSIAFKAAQIQSPEKAVDFLRYLRESLFLEKKNISKWDHIKVSAEKAGLDTDKLEEDYAGEGARLFEADLALRQQLGVRGFPTIFFVDSEDNRHLVYGTKPYDNYEKAILKMYPDAERRAYDSTAISLLNTFGSLTTMEFAVLAGKSFGEAEKTLEDLKDQHQIQKHQYRNGDLWKLMAA